MSEGERCIDMEIKKPPRREDEVVFMMMGITASEAIDDMVDAHR